ncbi:MAG: phenylalanyl-tRNA synthetase beta chain [Alteromonas naphthalenivorans]|jgi:phenylalanyl-tRNA synthetase beta chain
MKLSLRWVCDHLKIDWKKINVDKLVEIFNTSVAEIEDYQKYTIDLKSFALVKVISTSQNGCAVECPEWKSKPVLSARDDAQKGLWYLIKKNEKKVEWATPVDFLYEKEGLLPAFSCDDKQAASGTWKKEIETEDYILDVDNKSITHRPDLWSHRGFAREIAALLNITLISESQFLTKIPLIQDVNKFKATKELPFSISIKASGCKRFSALYIDNIAWQPSELVMATRLLRLDNRAIDLFVDATNYVMLDMGQPLHAFDADKLVGKTVEPRQAKSGEKLELLDGTKLKLVKDDIVVADSKGPLALAGIKGGLLSGVTSETSSILLEAGNFDATEVRLAATRHKIRTEASARFEKSLDPNQNVLGIMRFIKLLKDVKAEISYTPKIVSLGSVAKTGTIKVAHEFIEKRLGTIIKPAFIKKTLETIGFQVKDEKSIYTVTVPTYRATKDISIPEDIVEEVGRFYGYGALPLELPQITSTPEKDITTERIDLIKQLLASSAHMHEVQNYGFFDNEFLKQLNWKLNRPVTLANAISEQRTALATCLMPGLLQNVVENKGAKDDLRFFEWGRVWRTNAKNKNKVDEHRILAGLFYKRKGEVDFFESKEALEELFAALGLTVEWKKAEKPAQWASKYQMADLFYQGKNIGNAGKIAKSKLASIGGGDAFGFELCGDFLREFKPQVAQFKELPKYQATSLDVSVMVSEKTIVADLEHAIMESDKRIFGVVLQDIFVKDDWEDKKSITLRFFVRDNTKTLQKNDIDAVHSAVEKSLKKQGAQVR